MKTQTTSGALIAQASHAIYPSAPSGHCVRLKWFCLLDETRFLLVSYGKVSGVGTEHLKDLSVNGMNNANDIVLRTF